MKKLFKFVTVAMLALFSMSCEQPVPVLDVSTQDILVDMLGGDISFTVNATDQWTAKSSASWCVVKTSSGKNVGSVELYVAPNYDHNDRNCNITVTSGELSVQIKVTQSERETLLVQQTDYEITSAAQSIVINVNTTSGLSVTLSDEAKGWIDVQETKALYQKSLMLSIANNDKYDSRTGIVTIKNETGLKEDITIKQRAVHAILLSKHEYEISGEEQAIVLDFQSSFEDYDILVSDDAKEWIIPKSDETKALHDNSETILIMANPSGDDERHGMIIIKDRLEDVYEYVTVTQKAIDMMKPAISTLLITGEEQVFTVPYMSNMGFEYNVSAGNSWLSKFETKSMVHQDLPFAAKVNLSDMTRQGSISFESTIPGYNNDVEIRQLPLGKGILTIESEGATPPSITFNNQQTWQYFWDDGSISQINEMNWKLYEDNRIHTTKVLVYNPNSISIITTGVKVLDLRQY